jgi:excisionase family DNA binding protein
MQPSPSDTELITVERAAALFQVHVATVDRWIRKGAIPAVALSGGSLGIPMDVVRDSLGEYSASDTELVTVGRAATLLQVNITTVDRWIRDGTIPYVTLPSGSRRIPQQAILDSLGEHSAPNVEFITTGQAAALLQVNVHTMGTWVRAGKVPYVVLPSGSRRIPRDAFLKSLGGNYDLARELAKRKTRSGKPTEKQTDASGPEG